MGRIHVQCLTVKASVLEKNTEQQQLYKQQRKLHHGTMAHYDILDEIATLFIPTPGREVTIVYRGWL